MKKVSLLLVALALCGSSFAQSGQWALGVQWGGINNDNHFVGGQTTANARFHHDAYGSGIFGLNARYFVNEHWSVLTGLNTMKWGFNFAVTNDYSLMKKDGQYNFIKTTTNVAQIPAIAIYSFKPNCRNVRWFVGGGLSYTTGGGKVKVETAKEDAQNANQISQTASVKQFNSANGNLMFGVEKLLKRGSILSTSIIFNKGLSNIASSTVNYTIDGKSYMHKFTNNGNYWGLAVSYYFKPFKKKSA